MNINPEQVSFSINGIDCKLIDGKIISVYGVELNDTDTNAFLLTQNEPLSSVFDFEQH